MQTIIPVILSGGSGTRLWPMSRPDCPKQFLALTGDKTMFQLTALRTADPERFAPPIIVANARHADMLKAQLADIGVAPGPVILEPCARNTAPAIALAALEAGTSPMLVMPSDHVITDESAFAAAVAAALPLAEAGWLVTFGITPTGAETGYGYIRIGQSVGTGVHQVEAFIEKPDAEKAKAMLAQGGHVWNGGIFLFRADVLRDAMAAHAPTMLDCAKQAMDEAQRVDGLIKPDPDRFAACPADSIDYAIMEKASQVAVVPVAMGWSDVGSWDALYDIASPDSAGNSVSGDAVLIGVTNSLVRSDGIRISASGVDDLIIIASGQDVMIVRRGQSQAVKTLAEARTKQG